MGPVTTALVAVLAHTPARPEAPLELEWHAPAECPPREVIEDKVARALGSSERNTKTPVHAEVKIERTENGEYVLELVLTSEGQRGDRHLEGADCRQLADAVSLIVAVAIDPRVLERAGSDAAEPSDPSSARTDPESSEQLVPEQDPEAEQEDEPEPATLPGPTSVAPGPEPQTKKRGEARSQDKRLQLGLDVLAGVGLAVLPGPTAVVGLSLGLSGWLWRTELGAGYWTPVDEPSPANPEVGGRFQLWAVSARGCVAPAVGTVEIPVCAGIDAGAMHGRGTGDLDPWRSPMAPWVALASGASARWRPRRLGQRLGLWIRGEALVALARPRFGTEPSGIVYSVPVVGGDVVAGVEARLR